jgi:pimeloyl-ACP methyl ester carboxylesterase
MSHSLPSYSPTSGARAGSTDAVVFLHSLGGSAADWSAEMDALSSDHRVISVDLPGFGAAPVPATGTTLAAYADEVLDVLNGLGVAAATLVGLSMGGMVALQAAVRRPDRVAGLVLCSTTARVDDAVKAILGSCGDAIAAAGMAAFADGMVQQIFSPQMLLEPTPQAAAYIANLRASEPAGFISAASAIAGHDVEARLGELSCPALVIHGEADALIKPANGVRIASLIHGAKLELYPGCWHMTPLEEPLRFQKQLAAFISSI